MTLASPDLQPPRRLPSDSGDDTTATSPESHLRAGVLDRDRRFAERLLHALRARGCEAIDLSELPDPASLRALQLGVLVVDVNAIDSDALRLADGIRVSPRTAGVVCTEASTAAERAHGLRAGLDGWIEKPCHPLEVLARVEAILRARHSHRSVDHPVIRAGELQIRTDRYDALANGRIAGLTTREFEVLWLLCRHRASVLPRKRICAEVWGDREPTGDRSVDIYVSRIRRKLERISPDWSYLHTHFGQGYRFAAEARVDMALTRSPESSGAAPDRSRQSRQRQLVPA